MSRENSIQRDVELAIGAEPDLLILRNNVGQAKHINETTGDIYRMPYGLGVGSPDLVGILGPRGRWFCLELKQPGELPTAKQRACHAAWRRFGAFVATVTSVEEARAALEQARGES
jgi:hypothetical protein